jgi:hypothetical protein
MLNRTFISILLLSTFPFVESSDYYPNLSSVDKLLSLVKCKVHLLTGHEGTNIGSRWWWMIYDTSRPFYSQDRHSTHCTVGWVGSKAGLDRCGKTILRPDSILGPFRP